MKYNFEVLSRQYAVVALFVRHLAYARGLKADAAKLKITPLILCAIRR
jgi:hypothetical protein